MALGVHRALREAGRSVPSDVSIVGFDDSPSAAFWNPPLTTVRMDFVALGRACYAAARAQIWDEEMPVPDLPSPRLIVRQSTGPLPTST
nr:substrate-binding domain-containing protein [Planotetraspora mira]